MSARVLLQPWDFQDGQRETPISSLDLTPFSEPEAVTARELAHNGVFAEGGHEAKEPPLAALHAEAQ